MERKVTPSPGISSVFFFSPNLYVGIQSSAHKHYMKKNIIFPSYKSYEQPPNTNTSG